ncbi:MAG: UDP-glucosyltransferase, partial [Deltaproteobacteria bacterium]|nr:UDP-glucosyltransferase [Deltaproteobacteria bacterium]
MKRLRVVSYAINGRGMGHLVRQLAILRWLRRVAALLEVECECWVITSSEADTLARREGIPALKLPSKAMLRDAGLAPARYLAITRTWVLNAVAGLQPDVLLVDTFPGGSFGELVAALELAPHRVLVARRVREAFATQDPYRALLSLYEKVVVPDDRGTGPILIRDRSELLDRDDARRALGIPAGRRAVYVSLGGGGDLAAPGTLPRLVDRLAERGWHAVVGAGPLYEGPERRGPGVTWLDRYVPLELLTGVDAAVSACGYNTFHELMYAGVPTVFLPQERIADDQEERARVAVHA